MSGSLPADTYPLLICVTGALIAVLLLRLPLRHVFGAQIAYAIWLVVPIAVVGSIVGSLVPARALAPIALPIQAHLSGSASVAGQVPLADIHWIVVGWMIGAGLFALAQWQQQRAFVRRLGVLRYMPTGTWMGATNSIGPVVVGVFPPRVVLPTDFCQRYSKPEQVLVLAHESMHIIRHDPLANLVAAIMRSLLWFHPLVHLATRYFRIDQEFACDAAVLDIHPQEWPRYADAILKTYFTRQQLAAGCGLALQTASSLKRRIIMLQTPAPSASHRLLGASLVSVSCIAVGSLACGATTDAADTAQQHAAKVPSAPATLQLGGLGSAHRSNDPVVIVDGVRAKVANGTSPLGQIDPNSIAKIEVLKGPSAASRYGQDAANGVIVITRKSRDPKGQP